VSNAVPSIENQSAIELQQPRRFFEPGKFAADPAMMIGSFGLSWIVLYTPAYLTMMQTTWARPENAHGPFIIAICAGLAYAIGRNFRSWPAPSRTDMIAGLGVVVLAVLAYGYARIQEVELVLTATQPVVAFGAILTFFGVAGVRRFWFVLVLSLYLIAFPGWMIDLLTFPLKLFVSESVSAVLYATGYPVTHDGAVIQVGVYSLLVADACAGMNSLIALTSVGAVYLYAIRRGGWPVTVTVAALLIPIAVMANMVRVGVLVVITHHFGYDAGQGFLHEFSGVVMFVAALFLVFMVEAIAFVLVGRKADKPLRTNIDDESRVEKSMKGSWAGYSVSMIMIVAALITGYTAFYGPRQIADAHPAAPDLEAALPDAFGVWSRVQLSAAVLPPESVAEPGEVIAYRAYRDDLGRLVTLVVAYGPPASDTVRLHRPETCYVGQGFHIEKRLRTLLNASVGQVPINRLMARNATRHEAVSYWLRAGDDYAVSAATHQWINLRQGLGQRADGVLVRISSQGHTDAEFDLHLAFADALLSAVPQNARSVFVVEVAR